MTNQVNNIRVIIDDDGLEKYKLNDHSLISSHFQLGILLGVNYTENYLNKLHADFCINSAESKIYGTIAVSS